MHKYVKSLFLLSTGVCVQRKGDMEKQISMTRIFHCLFEVDQKQRIVHLSSE